MEKSLGLILLGLTLASFLVSDAAASSYSVRWKAFDSGGTVECRSGAHAGTASAGQSLIGYAGSPQYLTRIGFWGGTPFRPCSEIPPLWPSRMPVAFLMKQNFPNPFSDNTRIVYGLPSHAPVSITVLDICGRVVKPLENRCDGPGYYQILWDSTNQDGEKVAPGLYLCRFEAAGTVVVRKLVVAR
jgi:hypothetical protein